MRPSFKLLHKMDYLKKNHKITLFIGKEIKVGADTNKQAMLVQWDCLANNFPQTNATYQKNTHFDIIFIAL